MAETVMCLYVAAVHRVWFHTGTYVKRGSGTGVCASTSVVPCQYHFTNPQYSFIHLSAMLYNLSR